tara:strand:- start:577 stop:2076 length:1500 start_codon:yes stop_codon:yes gene_type:complete
MTINEPSLDSNKDAASLAWEKSVTEATNRMQHQIDNISESVNTSSSLVAVYARTLDGKGQQFTPFEEANGYVAYVPYTDAYPTLPLTGLTFAEYSNEAIDFVIKQYRETANRPPNPGSVQYTVTGGSWTESTNWDKTKLNRSGTNIWFCEAKIIGSAGEVVTAKWSDPKLLYGGAVATGILYYNTAQTSAPSAPPVDTSGTATGAVIDGYDYDSGVFSLGNDAALSTLGWQYVPITVAMSGANSINKKHWQVSFHVETLEVTNQAGTAPGQIITFGTVEGFIPIGSVLQSDNYSNQAGSLAGWQIDRSGNADFNNVNIRGNSTVAGSIVSGSLTSATISGNNIDAGTIDAVSITGSSISSTNIDVTNITITGQIKAENLVEGIVTAAYGGNGTGTIVSFTSSNIANVNTDIIVFLSAAGGATSSGHAGSMTVYFSGNTSLNAGISASHGQGGKVQTNAFKFSVAKNTAYSIYTQSSSSGNDGGLTYSNASATVIEVKRL